MTKSLPIGATIGILGGGQLGRMLSVAASRLGFKTCIFEPSSACPASHVSDSHIQASYEDMDALRRFAQSVDVITYEFENIPASALDTLETFKPIHPGRLPLTTSQDRLSEKTFLNDLGLKTAPFANVESEADLAEAIAHIGTPSILKTRRMGYDGKGQVRLNNGDTADKIWPLMDNQPCVLEGFIKFSHEVSVIGARAIDGRVACFDPGENLHHDGILHTTTVPARLNGAQRTDAVLLAGRILNALDYVGVMGVELFVTPQGLIINEIAPRVHNSGHWTQNGSTIDQFEQHIRAIAGWPLGDGSRNADVTMVNLIGDDVTRLEEFIQDSNTGIHLYGKSEVKPGRKMGHVNKVNPKT
ncbi:MAG: 5-(carboxyamino)imidazole ribonucleotide synthase [Litoreibacter sp.]